MQSAEGGLGYFGYTYFEENQDTLTDFAVDGVKPTAETITDGTYPLSRPLFIYVKKTSLAKPEVKAFVEYYLRTRSRSPRSSSSCRRRRPRWTSRSRRSAESVGSR